MCHSMLGTWLPGLHRQSAGKTTSKIDVAPKMKSLNEKLLPEMQTASYAHQKLLFHLSAPTSIRQAHKAIIMSGASSSEGAQQHSAGIGDTSRPTNRLAKEQSPYLLQHAHNPASHAPCTHALQRPSLPPCMHHISLACRWTGTPGASQLLTRPNQRTSQSFSVLGIRPAIGGWCVSHKLASVACSTCCFTQATPAHM